MDAFDVLGVTPNSDKETCKAAYRKLASTHHPDKGGDTAKFQSLQVAWDAIENGYRRITRKQPDVSSYFTNKAQHTQQQTPQNFTRDPRAATFADVFERFMDSNGWANTNKTVINVRPTAHSHEFQWRNHHFEIPAGIPDGWTKTLVGRKEMVGNSGTISGDFRIKLQIPHDPSMMIQGIDGTMSRLPFANAIGDAICTINTHAMNLIVGAWVQIRDVFNQPHTVRIPEGFDPNHRLRVAGAGYYHWNAQDRLPILTSRGDLFVQVVPTFSSWDKMPEMDKAHAKEKLEMLFA